MSENEGTRGRAWLWGASLVVGLCSVACAQPPVAKVSGRWVYAAGDSAGIGKASTPRLANPITLTEGGACFPLDKLDGLFGPSCEAHETEGGGGDVPLSEQVTGGGAAPVQPPGAVCDPTLDPTCGNHPPPREVRWYCHDRVVIRIVLNGCGNNQAAVAQIAVAIDGE
jgi:hypothetical protein